MIKINKLKIDNNDTTLVDASFTIESSTALVGQSGSGKSLILKSILDLAPNNLKLTKDIESSFNLIKGDTVSFVPQNPFTALSPMTKISKQSFGSKNRVKELFEMLNLEWRLYNEYPVNLSGGQLQRVVFAFSLINNPKLLLLDEPTTALDSKLKDDVVNILNKLQKEYNFLMLFVTHEINLASKLCENIVVLNNGNVIEKGKVESVMLNPKSSYTKELIDASFANREFRK